MAKISLGSLYDFNKQAMKNEPILDMIEKNKAIDTIAEELINNEAQAWMCLNNERKDFTVFYNSQEKKLKGNIKQDLREYLDNRGDLISVDKQAEGAYEIWLKIDNDCFCYMLFDYSNAIIYY